MKILAIIVPLVMSTMAGILIGYLNKRSTGIGGARTFAIICCGSTLVTLISRYFFVGLGRPWFADPGRLSAQIIPALVFLSLGILLFTESRSQQILVGANVWLTAMVGMMLGSGFGHICIYVIGFVILVYFILERIENMLNNRRSSLVKRQKKAEP